jgi:hypothetical protein
MNARSLNDAQIAAALQVHLPTRAQAGLRGRLMETVETTSQQRPLPSFLGALSDADPIRRRRSLLIAVALLLGLALATAAAAGAWQLLRRDKVPQLDLTSPSDVPAFVLSMYDRMPQLPPMAITTLEDGSVKGRIYVDRSGEVRFDHYATPDAPEPDRSEIFNGTTMSMLATVGSAKEWFQQGGGDGSTIAFSQGGVSSADPRFELLGVLEGGGAPNQPGCGVTHDPDEVGDWPAPSGWKYVATEYIDGRPTFHVTCGGGDLWIDVETRLILRSRGLVQGAPDLPVEGQPIPGASGAIETIEVTDLEFGEQPADLFARPPGVAAMPIDTYACQVNHDCSPPPPSQPAYAPAYTTPPGAIAGPLPSLSPSRVSNGWIAYSTAPYLDAGDAALFGSDVYIAREGVEPKLVASREGGTLWNVCPAFSPDGTRLAYGVVGPQGREVAVLGLDANGVIHDPVSIGVPGSGAAPCPRWSSDGKRVAYLDGGAVVVRGLDGSTQTSAAGDPSVTDFDPSYPRLSPSGAWTVRLVSTHTGCQMVVAKPDGTAAHVLALGSCPYTIAAWSPDGRQVLLMMDVGDAYAMQAIAVDSLAEVTIVTHVPVGNDELRPDWGDVSWQPVFP